MVAHRFKGTINRLVYLGILVFLILASGYVLGTGKFVSAIADQKAPEWKSKGGTWEFSPKRIFGEGTSKFNKAYCVDKSYSNFIYEVRLRKISRNDGPIGLLMRYDERRDEGYMLLIWPHGDYQYSRLVNHERHRENSGTPKALNKGNAWNRIKIIGHDDKLEFYLNGELLAKLNGDTYSFGRLGLVVAGGPEQKAEFEVLSMNEF